MFVSSLSSVLRRLLVLVLVAGAALAVSTASALADSASLTFLDAAGRNDPVAGIGRTFTLTGTTTSPQRTYVKYRRPGGAACAPTAETDSGTSLGAFYGNSVNGNFAIRNADIWRTPGDYSFCIWIAANSATVASPITQVVRFRSPTGTVSATFDPPVVPAGEGTTMTVTGAAETPSRVYAKARRAGGAPCAASPDTDAGDYVLSGVAVDGAFSVRATFEGGTLGAGEQLVCLWVASSSTDTAPIAGPQPATFTVQAAPPPPPPVTTPTTPTTSTTPTTATTTTITATAPTTTTAIAPPPAPVPTACDVARADLAATEPAANQAAAARTAALAAKRAAQSRSNSALRSYRRAKIRGRTRGTVERLYDKYVTRKTRYRRTLRTFSTTSKASKAAAAALAASQSRVAATC